VQVSHERVGPHTFRAVLSILQFILIKREHSNIKLHE
jgi:hypothetical protein